MMLALANKFGMLQHWLAFEEIKGMTSFLLLVNTLTPYL